MKNSTRKLLEDFSSHANWRTVGLPSDMERFLDFITEAYRNGEYEISLDEFLDVIKTSPDHRKTNLSSRQRELASKMFMFNKYEDGIKLLRKYERKT